MLGGLPKLFDRAFAIGFLLPVVIGLIGLSWIVPDTPLLAPLHAITVQDESLGKLTYLLLLTYGLAILLVATNTFQYRLLEGYLLPKPLFDHLARPHQARRTALHDELQRLESLRDADPATFSAEDQQTLNATFRKTLELFPPERLTVMPTRFGNVIRAFEAYPFDAYGADGPPVWLRLGSVIGKDGGAALDDARAQVNLFLNLLFITLLLIPIALIDGVATTPWRALADAVHHQGLHGWAPRPSLIVLIVAVAAVWPCYLLAVDSAKAWGAQVKATFDTYLPALIKQLGYAPPKSETARRAVWAELNALFVYWQPIDDARAPLDGAEPPSAPASSPRPRWPLGGWLAGALKRGSRARDEAP